MCVSMGQSLQKLLKVPCKRQVLVGMPFSSAVTSLYKRNNTRKQEADWKVGRERVWINSHSRKNRYLHSISLNVGESQYPCCRNNR